LHSLPAEVTADRYCLPLNNMRQSLRALRRGVPDRVLIVRREALHLRAFIMFILHRRAVTMAAPVVIPFAFLACFFFSANPLRASQANRENGHQGGSWWERHTRSSKPDETHPAGQVVLPRQYSALPPQKGTVYTSAFGVQVIRLSDSIQDRSRWTEADYATQNHFNADETRIFVNSDSHLKILDLKGKLLREFVHIGTSSEPMWDHFRPTRLWYHVSEQNSLRYVDVATGSDHEEHNFREYKLITGKGESDISPDGEKIVLLSDTGDIFTYNLTTHTKSPVLNIGTNAVDWLQVSNRFVVVGFANFGGVPAVRVYDTQMRFQRQLASYIGHSDIGLDSDGDEVLAIDNSGEHRPDCTNSVVKYRLSDGRSTCLVRGDPAFSWVLSMHIALPLQGNGWVYVSTDAPSDPQPGSANWPAFANEIVRIKLDGSGVVQRLAHHYSRPFPGNDYEWQPRASVNAKGTKVLFNSTWGLHYKLKPPPETRYVDTYLLNVP